MNQAEAYCHNCEAPVSGRFCSNCGQRTSVHKVTFGETFQDFWDFVFSVNAPLFITLKLLITNPGRLFREYLAGKRKQYYKPVAFFILLTVLHILIRNLIGFDAMENVTPYEREGIDTTKVVEAGRFMFENINNLLFFYVFSLGFLLKLMFWKRYSLAEYIAVAFYLIGLYILLGTFNIFFMKFVNPDIQILAALGMLIYLVYAMISFLKTPVIWIALKTVVANILGFLLYVVLAYAISFVIIFFF